MIYLSWLHLIVMTSSFKMAVPNVRTPRKQEVDWPTWHGIRCCCLHVSCSNMRCWEELPYVLLGNSQQVDEGQCHTTKPGFLFSFTVFPHIVSAETILFWIHPYVLWPLITVHTGAETIQVRKLFKGWNYSRKYGSYLLSWTIIKICRLCLFIWVFKWNQVSNQKQQTPRLGCLYDFFDNMI